MRILGRMQSDRFLHTHYIVRRKVFKLFGAAFHVYGPNDKLVLYSKMKAFKLKEDIRLYTDEDMKTEVLSIQARSVIDWGASYDVVDTTTGQKVGALRRKGWKSIIKDEWIILDPNDQEIGLIMEDSQLLALIRRFIELATLLLPQKFHAEMSGQTVAIFSQNMNPFVRKLACDFSPDSNGLLDRRLGLAAAILLGAIEGKQE
jgi:hypothetical protein